MRIDDRVLCQTLHLVERYILTESRRPYSINIILTYYLLSLVTTCTVFSLSCFCLPPPFYSLLLNSLCVSVEFYNRSPRPLLSVLGV